MKFLFLLLAVTSIWHWQAAHAITVQDLQRLTQAPQSIDVRTEAHFALGEYHHNNAEYEQASSHFRAALLLLKPGWTTSTSSPSSNAAANSPAEDLYQAAVPVLQQTLSAQRAAASNSSSTNAISSPPPELVQQAVSNLTLSAQQGNAAAQFELGIIFSQGWFNQTQNNTLSLSWLSKAAANGHVGARDEFSIQALNAFSTSTFSDETPESVFWSQTLIQQAISSSNVDLVAASASVPNVNSTIDQEIHAAYTLLTWLQSAALQRKNSRAIFLLASFLESGKITRMDEKQAVLYYEEAAELKFAPAQAAVGLIYLNGFSSVPKNETLAAYYIGLAANQNFPRAQIWFSRMYQHGLGGLPVDPKAAWHWAQEAALAEDEDAIYQVGIHFANGFDKIVPVDVVRAKEFLQYAAQKGHPLASKALTDLKERTDSQSDSRSE